MHSIPTKFAVASNPKVYLNKQNKLKPSSFADYDMVQAEIRWIRNTDKITMQNKIR
jgi:hypothetical protein